MKKLLCLLLAVMLTLALVGCGNTAPAEEPAQEETTTSETEESADSTETEETAFPEILADTDLTIAEGLPAIRFDGTWKKFEDNIQSEDFESLGLYMNQDPEAFDIAVQFFSWEKTKTLMEEATAAMQYSYPNQEYLTLFENNYWNEEGDSNYVYYCAFDETSFEDYTYCQAYFFEVDNTIYEVDYYVATEAITLYDGLQFFGPKCTEAYEPNDVDLEKGCVASRYCTYNVSTAPEFCSFDLYAFDKGDDTIETATQWFYDNKENVISAEPYTFTSRLGNEYEGVYVTYENTYIDGVKYYNATYCELVGDKIIAVNCYVPAEGMDEYTMVSSSAMSYAIFGY